MCFGEGKGKLQGMLHVLAPLQRGLENGPQPPPSPYSTREHSFHVMYGGEFREGWVNLEQHVRVMSCQAMSIRHRQCQLDHG